MARKYVSSSKLQEFKHEILQLFSEKEFPNKLSKVYSEKVEKIFEKYQQDGDINVTENCSPHDATATSQSNSLLDSDKENQIITSLNDSIISSDNPNETAENYQLEIEEDQGVQDEKITLENYAENHGVNDHLDSDDSDDSMTKIRKVLSKFIDVDAVKQNLESVPEDKNTSNKGKSMKGRKMRGKKKNAKAQSEEDIQSDETCNENDILKEEGNEESEKEDDADVNEKKINDGEAELQNEEKNENEQKEENKEVEKEKELIDNTGIKSGTKEEKEDCKISKDGEERDDKEIENDMSSLSSDMELVLDDFSISDEDSIRTKCKRRQVNYEKFDKLKTDKNLKQQCKVYLFQLTNDLIEKAKSNLPEVIKEIEDKEKQYFVSLPTDMTLIKLKERKKKKNDQIHLNNDKPYSKNKKKKKKNVISSDDDDNNDDDNNDNDDNDGDDGDKELEEGSDGGKSSESLLSLFGERRRDLDLDDINLEDADASDEEVEEKKPKNKKRTQKKTKIKIESDEDEAEAEAEDKNENRNKGKNEDKNEDKNGSKNEGKNGSKNEDKKNDENKRITRTLRNANNVLHSKRKKVCNISDSDSNDSVVRVRKRVAKVKDDEYKADDNDQEEEDDDSSIILSDSSNDPQLETDSDDESKNKKKKRKQKPKKPPTKRRRIIQLSSDEEKDSENEEKASQKPKRRNIKKILNDDQVQRSTRDAAQEEKERRERISEKQKFYNELSLTRSLSSSDFKELILEFDQKNKKVLVEVGKQLVKSMKPHQGNGIRFMYDCTIESIERLKKTQGSGCILAHSMGLGKTFQVIAFLHTIMTNKYTKDKMKRVLIICPKNTTKNWGSEFHLWLIENNLADFIIFDMDEAKTPHQRQALLSEWHEDGGVFIISYNMFANLVNGKMTAKKVSKKILGKYKEYLADPGADLVVCDEGHQLKNDKTSYNRAVSEIRTMRRIVLTGTPLQNNLTEYYVMVNFVKPNLLGSKKEFQNRFANPIDNGQHEDSTERDVRIMKRRVHILHRLLNSSVHRCDYNVLVPYLQPKYEYVLSVALSETQINIYKHYLSTFVGDIHEQGQRVNLLSDFSVLLLLCNHPSLLFDQHERRLEKEEEKEDSLDGFIVSDSDSDVEAIDENPQPKRKMTTRQDKKLGVNDENEQIDENIIKTWFTDFISPNDRLKFELSGKFNLFFHILEECEKMGDKVLVFSQSLDTLDLLEEFLENKNIEMQDSGALNFLWIRNRDYFRIDGSTSSDDRKQWIDRFNDESNLRARLFLLSTKAGGLGINLVGANRCIIFDASWNPTHDVQAIFRIFRFGQNKPVYVYRFLAQGAMEEKVYKRQIKKQSLSCRVIDEQQIQRHFKASDLQELYTFEPDTNTERPTPILPKDKLLAELLIKYKHLIVTYHEHDSLLENRPEEDLTEEERQSAWQEYEMEKEVALQQEQQAAERKKQYELLMAQQQANHLLMQQLKQQGIGLPDYDKITIEHLIKYYNHYNPGLDKNTMINAVRSFLVNGIRGVQTNLSEAVNFYNLTKNADLIPEINKFREQNDNLEKQSKILDSAASTSYIFNAPSTSQQINPLAEAIRTAFQSNSNSNLKPSQHTESLIGQVD